MEQDATMTTTWEDELLDGAQEFETNGGEASRKFRGKAISSEAMRTSVREVLALLPTMRGENEDDFVEIEIDNLGKKVFDVDATIAGIRQALTEAAAA